MKNLCLKSQRGSAVLVASVLLLGGCASQEPLPELVAARQAVQRASADPDSATAGAVRLAEAREALADAEEASRAGGDEELILDRAFVATRNADIAAEQAAEARARRAVTQGEAERNRVLLEARSREAVEARADAAANRASAEASAAAAEEARRQLEALQARPTERGMVLTLGDVLFETARAEVKAGARENIERVAEFLAENPETRVVVEGHTDSRGSDEYNRDLSRRRAEAVRDVLAAAGVARDRVQAVGMGEGYPVAGNDSAAGQQQNRRVEIVFSDESGAFARSDGRREVL